jgi:hypothetical protein
MDPRILLSGIIRSGQIRFSNYFFFPAIYGPGKYGFQIFDFGDIRSGLICFGEIWSG